MYNVQLTMYNCGEAHLYNPYRQRHKAVATSPFKSYGLKGGGKSEGRLLHLPTLSFRAKREIPKRERPPI